MRTLRQIYQDYESSIDPDLLRYLGRLPRDRQRRLLLLLQGMETVVGTGGGGKDGGVEDLPPDTDPVDDGIDTESALPSEVRASRVRA
jgi:hypothetical protein